MTLFLVFPAVAQQMPPEMMSRAQEAMSKLAWLEGSWTGEGWMQLGPGNRESSQVFEKAELKLDGTLLKFEGLGTSEGRTVHSAIGMVTFSPITSEYSMRAYRPGGLFIDADFSVEDDKIVWGFDDPRAGKIR